MACSARGVASDATPVRRYSAGTRGTGMRCPPCSRSPHRCPSTAFRPATAASSRWSAGPPRAAFDPVSAAAARARRCSVDVWERGWAPVSLPPDARMPRAPSGPPCRRPARRPAALDTKAEAALVHWACRTATRSPPRERPAFPSPPCPQGPECGRVLSSIDRLRFGYESHVLHTCPANHRKHLYHASVGDSTIGPQIHPRGPFRSHEGGKGGPEVFIREPCLIEIDLAVHVHRDDQSLLRLDGADLRARQSYIHPALHDRRGDHENDEQDEGDVHERRHIDVGIERQLAMPAQATATPAEESSTSH